MISWRSGISGHISWSEALTARGTAAAPTPVGEIMVEERLEKEFLTDADDVKKMAQIMSAGLMKEISWRWLS